MTFLAGVNPEAFLFTVAINGLKGAGKSYAAQVIHDYLVNVKLYPHVADIEILACANVLKNISSVLLGWTMEFAQSDAAKDMLIPPLNLSRENLEACVAILCRQFIYQSRGCFVSADIYAPDAYIPEFNRTQKELMAQLVAAIDRILVPNTNHAPLGMKYGAFLQQLGTEGLRTTVHPDIFATIVYHAAVEEGVDILIIPDARFPEEFMLCDLLRGHALRIVREDGGGRAHDGRDAKHASETALDGVEMDVIVNRMDATFADEVRAWVDKKIEPVLADVRKKLEAPELVSMLPFRMESPDEKE